MKAFSDPQSPVRRMTRAATEVVFGRAKSIRATVMQLTTCTLGAGILTLPFALSCFGLGLGLIVLVCNSAFALVCSYFLSMACSLSGEYSYGGLARAAGGETMALVVDILILMVLLMVMAGGIDALGDSLGQVVVEIFGGGCTMTAVAANGTSAFLLSSSGNGTGGNGNGGAPEWSGGWCAWAHGAKLIAAHTAKVTGAVSVAPTLSGRLAVTAIATFGFLVPLSLVPVAALRFSSLFSVISLVLIVFFIVSRGIASVSHPPAATSGDPEDDPWTFANLFKLGAWRDWLHGISLVAFAFANQIQIPMFQLDLEPVPVFFSSTPRGDVASPSASPDGHRNGGTKRPSDGPGGLQAKIDAADQEDRQMPLLAANRHVIDVVDDFADVRTPPSSFNHERPSASSFSSSRGGDLNSAVASAEEREELRGKLAARQGSGDKMKLVILFTSLTLSCLFCTIAAFGLISAEGGKVADDILQQYKASGSQTVTILTTATRALMCFVVLCSFPLQVAPAREAIIMLSSKAIGCVRHTSSRRGARTATAEAVLDRSEAMRAPAASRHSQSDRIPSTLAAESEYDGDGFTEDEKALKSRRAVVHVVATITIAILAFALSTAASKLSEVFGLAGASCGAILLYILPCVFYATFARRTDKILLKENGRRKVAIVVAWCCAVVGAVVGTVCTTYIVYGIVDEKIHPSSS